MDKRNCIRVDYSAEARIRCNGRAIVGRIDNVSLQGLFVKITQEMPLDLPLEITVFQDSATSFNLKFL